MNFDLIFTVGGLWYVPELVGQIFSFFVIHLQAFIPTIWKLTHVQYHCKTDIFLPQLLLTKTPGLGRVQKVET
jgi:hypothetical protein